MRRFGGDPETRERALAKLAGTRDRVLDGAGLRRGETLLDVGCGEGLIGFGALERGAATVVFSDVSADLLEFCRQRAADMSVTGRCRFVEARAEDLGAIDAGSVDVVTTRSVLIYVRDKAGAFREFARVLRPGGRISVFEPINRFAQNPERWGGYDLRALGELEGKLRAVYESLQPPESDPMLDFDERDLVRFAEAADFFPVRLELEAVVEPRRRAPGTASCTPPATRTSRPSPKRWRRR
ncbi:MAG TPA: class I SAM-dependent methyltransferase [Gaiellaceae bacterium]|nr:class I SAM-dependent methyltransferase [Gaiellaceae bacterium]